MRLNYDLRKLYLDSLAPQWGETVTFVNDVPADESEVTDDHSHRAEMTAAWHAVMAGMAEDLGITVKPVVTIDLKDPAAGKLKALAKVDGKDVDFNEIMDGWGEKDIVIAITGPSITAELMRRLAIQRFRFASAPNVRADFEGFKADYSKIPLRFEALTSRMAKAVTCEMTFRLDEENWTCNLDLRGQRYQYNENGTAHRPGEFINLPSGCANVPPYPGIDGDSRGPSRTGGEIPAIIDGEIVVYRVAGGKIVDVIGDSDQAKTEAKHVLDPEKPELAVITKLGLGVNDEGRCNGTHVGDEKTMGMHWGYGPKKHFPDTIWAEHPISLDMDFVYPDGSRDAIFRSNLYVSSLGEEF